MSSMEQEVLAEVERARDAYRHGVPPSQIVTALLRRGWNCVALFMLGREAFYLRLSECKGAEGVDGRLVDAPVFDAYIVPRIERMRSQWDC